MRDIQVVKGGGGVTPPPPPMEFDLQSLFWAPCAQLYSLAETPQPRPPPIPLHLGSYMRALLVSQDRRNLFVTLWF
jgi:hypothetical protein